MKHKNIMKKFGFIYIIKNSINNKVYIGQTTQSVEVRFKQHIKCLKSNSKQAVSRAIKKYGKDKFFYEVLEKCTIEKLDEKEEYYIKKYSSFSKGYNLNGGGSQSRKPLLKICNPIVIAMYKQEFSQREIAKICNVSHSTIGKILNLNKIPCRRKSHKLTKHSKISEQQLKPLLQKNLSFRKIAKILNVSDKAVRKAVDRYSLRNIIVKN